MCLWGVSEADWQKSFSLHLHVKWPGCDTAGERRAAGENEERFPGQCYVTSSITDHRPSVYKQRWVNLQLNLYPVLTAEESTEQLAQFI